MSYGCLLPPFVPADEEDKLSSIQFPRMVT